ncbi:hypothetical protein T01_3261 [Trichinella spiralis]|uniref:Uncharacterized protein n=1 Tax=Trichinella spiralis TaxID=6334 RepID=A0A0V0Z1S4_TRISP|nr:hypothetical protein T01_3261 [Trichinella spiralis]
MAVMQMPLQSATKPYLMYSASYLRFFGAIVRIVFHANVQYNFCIGSSSSITIIKLQWTV